MGRKERKNLLVVFLTKELHCGVAERETISGSLCFILEWLRRKIINTMKSKIFSGTSSINHRFSSFSFSEELAKIKFMMAKKHQNKSQILTYSIKVCYRCFHVCEDRPDGWKSFWMDGQVTGKWINTHGWLNKPTLTSPWSEKTHNKRATQRSERRCPCSQKRDNAKRKKRLWRNTGIHAAPILV